MTKLGKSGILFVAIGLVLYGAVYWAAERLQYATGRSNPFFKIATAQQQDYDWVVLGASHAMPLDFADFNAHMERETGLKILNLAATGAGPLYNRFVLEHFLGTRRTANLLYVVDAFAFLSPIWNEERFSDAKLLRRTPFQTEIARRLVRYSRLEGVSPLAVVDYVCGFSKINNRERFAHDIWEGESQFERVFRPSVSAVAKRIDYLYPQPAEPSALARYATAFDDLIALAQSHGVHVIVLRMPLPAQFRSRQPGEAAFNAELTRVLAHHQVPLRDFSFSLSEPRFYFDTDHLNHAGANEFFNRHLRAILRSPSSARNEAASIGPCLTHGPH